MVESIVQVYQDVGGKTLFAQVMKVDLLEDRRKESQELEFNLDGIIEGTEVIYESDLTWPELNKHFFIKIAKIHENWKKDESSQMTGEKRIVGVSYSFFPQYYEQLNKEIKDKLRLKIRK